MKPAPRTRQVYLDHQAATPLLPEVLASMQPFLTTAFGNAGSLHQHGLQARDALEQAREQMATLIHAGSPEEILFTSDGTEAANLAIKGTAWSQHPRRTHLVSSTIEHPAVLGSLEFLERHSFSCARVRVDGEGFLDLEDLASALTDQTALLAVHLVNHDVGTLQRLARIAALASDRGVTLYVDAEAAAGWVPIDVEAMGIDLLSFSPHRFHGPKGVGVLYRNRRARLTSLIHGGVQEGGRRAGTENIPAIVGAGLAAEIAGRALPRRAGQAAALQRQLWDGLQARVPFLHLNGPPPGPDRSPAQLNFSTEFVEGEGLLLLLDTRGIAVASGTSCISKSIKMSPVLAALGLDPALGLGALQMSLGQDNTPEEIEYVLETFTAVVTKLRAMSPTWDEYERGTLDSLIAPRTAKPRAGSGGNGSSSDRPG